MGLSVDQALEKGLTAYNSGDLQEANRLCQVVLSLQSKHPEANHILGLIAASSGKPKLALGLFKTALEADPKVEKFWLSYIDSLVAEGHVNPAKAVIAESRRMGLISQNISAREAQLNQKDQQAPTELQIGELLAYFKSGQLLEAEKLALSITDSFALHPFGWKVLGVLYGQTDRNKDALIANQKAVKFAPQDDEAHSNLGNVLRKLGRLDEAEVSSRRAADLNPELAENHNNLGATLQEMGKLDEARGCYQRAIALKPDFAEAHNNLAALLRQLGHLEEAEASCRQVIALEPNFALAHFDLGIVLRELGKVEAAEVSFRQAILLKSDFAAVHNSLGGTLREQGRLEEAEASYRRAIELEPNFALAHCNLAVALKDLGKLNEAESSCKQALTLDPDFAEAHYNLGTLFFENEQYREAGEQFSLVDIHQSQLFAIKCAYHTDNELVFNGKLEDLVSQGLVNAVVGSLSCCAEAKYGASRPNPFCKEPLKLVSQTNLTERYDFEEIFASTARDILSDPEVSRKEQVHLSNGIQTAGNIFALRKVLDTQIIDIIKQEIENYRDKFERVDEGLMKHWPDEYEISGWLVSMQNGGSLTAHMHDTGWITGSLYISVPPKVQADSGNLVLRMHDQKLSLDQTKTQEASIDVRTGTLCFFPSSLLHHTVPFESDENRIVLAFDVIPKSS